MYQLNKGVSRREKKEKVPATTFRYTENNDRPYRLRKKVVVYFISALEVDAFRFRGSEEAR